MGAGVFNGFEAYRTQQAKSRISGEANEQEAGPVIGNGQQHHPA